MGLHACGAGLWGDTSADTPGWRPDSFINTERRKAGSHRHLKRMEIYLSYIDLRHLKVRKNVEGFAQRTSIIILLGNIYSSIITSKMGECLKYLIITFIKNIINTNNALQIQEMFIKSSNVIKLWLFYSHIHSHFTHYRVGDHNFERLNQEYPHMQTY